MDQTTTLNKDYGTHPKTFATYFTGFILCIFLTIIPFYAVIHKIASRTGLLWILILCAIAQFMVQVICFLRLHARSDQGKMNVQSFWFTGVVAVVIIGGSLWIMKNLNYFMMH